MSENVREVIEQHHAFYEVIPYYVELEERPHGATAAWRRIQALISTCMASKPALSRNLLLSM